VSGEPAFWLVWCEGGGAPTAKHQHFESAKREAQRLARMNPGHRFTVMAATVGFTKRDLDETRFRLCDLPDLGDEVPF